MKCRSRLGITLPGVSPAVSAALAVLIVLAALAVGSGVARAQQIKGRTMVMVDTSGSMVWHFNNNNTCGGDGDAKSLYTDINQANKNYYPGADGKSSRLYAAKAALTNVVNSTGDLDFGLMRYAPDFGVRFSVCQNAVNCCDFATPGCTNYLQNGYSDNGGNLNWQGNCGTVTNGIAVDGGQILVQPSSTSARPILTWVDGVEVFLDDGTGMPKNGELRASGSTPLAGAARTALNKWYQPILNHTRANPNCNPANDTLCDPQIDCRPYVFIMMTDGADTCDTDSDNAPPAAVKALYAANPKNPVLTYVIGLAFMQGDPAIAVLNNMAVQGGTKTARFANDEAAIEAAMADIVASSVKVEYCNNKDDNCNGLVDEGYDKGAACHVGIGGCLRNGIKKCDPNNNTQTTCCVDDGMPNGACVPLVAGKPQAEQCNGIDDDCNGVIDDPPVCQMPRCIPETCNGKDDDCDGVIDNNLIDTGRACGFSLGQCKPGATQCQNSMGKDVSQMGVKGDANDHLVCAGATTPMQEICDGLDNDCDGVVDGMSRPCYDGLKGTEGNGPCHGGTQSCTAILGSGMEMWGACVGEVLPGKEVCNGIDDDCNGVVDDVKGANVPCCPSGKCGVGICKAGMILCSGGMPACVGGQGPLVEVCNGIDDDCDGQVDNLGNIGAACLAANGCPGTLQCDLMKMMEVCVGQQMICNPAACGDDPHFKDIGMPCGPGAGKRMPCKAGVWVCTNNVVVCQGGVGPATETCNCIDDDCNGIVDDNAFCPNGTSCIACACLAPCAKNTEFPCPGGFDCYTPPCKAVADCPAGNTCDAGFCNPGYCAPNDNCKPACVAPLVCRNGMCVDACIGVACRDGQICKDGNCVRHDCVTNPEICKPCVNGAGGERCDASQGAPKCVPDACCGVKCDATSLCDQMTGKCADTCRNKTCNPDQVCVGGACLPKCMKSCAAGQFCDPRTGNCEMNDPRCMGIVCTGVQTCCQGACVIDPCATAPCGRGYRCRSLPDCTTVCDAIPGGAQDTVVGAGGSGLAFGCTVGAGHGGGGTGLLLLLVMGLVRLGRRDREVG